MHGRTIFGRVNHSRDAEEEPRLGRGHGGGHEGFVTIHGEAHYGHTKRFREAHYGQRTMDT